MTSFLRSLVLFTALWMAVDGIADSYRRHWAEIFVVSKDN
jgi:hypothetical protein